MSEHPTVVAAIILALVLIGGYAPIIFLDQSYNQSQAVPPDLSGYSAKKKPFTTTLDPIADSDAIWPALKLATQLIAEGKIPLWNPYIGSGQPLAADTDHYVFSPLILEHLLPVEFWDFTLLVNLWLAGLFTFIFLRSLGLNFTASISGSLFYSLSGSFTWYMPHTHVVVMVFTPLILYSLEKIIQERNKKSIALASIAFSFGMLGAHLESIILQLFLASLFLLYRTLPLLHSIYRGRKIHKLNIRYILTSNTTKIITYSLLAFIGGLGLSSFFIFPVYEFINNSYMSHNGNEGLVASPPYVLLSTFVPYALGGIHNYWSPEIQSLEPWYNLWYVGAIVLFFSIVGVFLSIKNKNTNIVHKYTPLFFISISIFFMMKTAGLPIANWIGYLPIFNELIFTRYVCVIIPVGFTVAAAFGIDLLSKTTVKTKHLGQICIISILIILLLAIPLTPYLFSPNAKFVSTITSIIAIDYVGFQILQSILFIFMAFLISTAIIKNKSAYVGVVPLIFLELSLYIPLGLHPIWMAFRSIIVISCMIVLIFLILKKNISINNLVDTYNRKIKFFIIGTLVFSIIGGILISELNPPEMTKRHDSFSENSITDFLKENVGQSRIFSFEYILSPNSNSPYNISSPEILSAFNIKWYQTFYHNFLDKDAWVSTLGFPPWTDAYGSNGSIKKFYENKKYFDFLGVKYILTKNYDLFSLPPDVTQYSQLESLNNDTSQTFVSPYDTIDAIGVTLGTYGLNNHGHIILSLDSIPYDKKYHDESILNAQNITNAQSNIFVLTKPLSGVKDKQFYFSLKYPETNPENRMAVFTFTENSEGLKNIRDKLKGKYYENSILVEGKQMVFSIINKENQPVSILIHGITINENKDAFPRVFLVSKFMMTNSYENAQNIIKDPNFDLRHQVVLEGSLPLDQSDLLQSFTLDKNSDAEITSYDANKVTIHTQNSEASLLVFTDIYYPGWKAYVDGKETTIYRADGLVRTIFLPSGNHIIEFTYLPQSFIVGAIISLGTTGILLGMITYRKRNGKTQY